jgi:hypothetical protein
MPGWKTTWGTIPIGSSTSHGDRANDDNRNQNARVTRSRRGAVVATDEPPFAPVSPPVQRYNLRSRRHPQSQGNSPSRSPSTRNDSPPTRHAGRGDARSHPSPPCSPVYRVDTDEDSANSDEDSARNRQGSPASDSLSSDSEAEDDRQAGEEAAGEGNSSGSRSPSDCSASAPRVGLKDESGGSPMKVDTRLCCAYCSETRKAYEGFAHSVWDKLQELVTLAEDNEEMEWEIDVTREYHYKDQSSSSNTAGGGHRIAILQGLSPSHWLSISFAFPPCHRQLRD